MRNFRTLLFLFSFICFVSCKNEYKEYTKKPDYITSPSGKHKAYFDAYDETLEQWGIDYDELYITTSHGIAHVIVSGKRNAQPVVLFHGMNASSTMWYPNAKTLAEDYRIFAIDLLTEPGKSYKTADFKNIDEITAWNQEVLWALKLESFHLVGASRGGWLAVDLALKHQNDIKSMVLLSPAQTFIWIRPTTGLLKNIFSIFASKDEQIEGSLGTLSKNTNNIDESYLKQYNIGVKNDTLPKFMMQMTPFSQNELQSLKMPVLVLIGDEDIINNEKTLRLVARDLSQGQGAIIPNAGHFISVDQAEVVNKKIISFLENLDESK
ncbi:alpha/beta fold hydrolase [Aequorivita capsosiphonis]|uniref:alpha/beta fold hydrolase n=1 Tax=Aequorivita capsosiphonis TaxID=487317 RepID=UPI000558626D|nr:alpha/beta hydrolase [Aequorivita capsosiphonis]